jgi:hypothetical protein
MQYSALATTAFFLLFANPALSQEETPQLDIQVERELVEAEIEMRDTKEAQCMKAIGAKEFCSCISDESPDGI